MKQEELTMKTLEEHAILCLSRNENLKLLIEMPGFEDYEIIINKPINIAKKIQYYKEVYDENCNHKFSKGIKIKAFII